MSLQWVSEQPKSTFNNNKLNLFLTLYYIITLDWPANWQATQGGPVIVSDVWLLMNLVPLLLVLKLVPIFLVERAKNKGWWKTQVMEKHDTVVEKKNSFSCWAQTLLSEWSSWSFLFLRIQIQWWTLLSEGCSFSWLWWAWLIEGCTTIAWNEQQ